MKFSKLYKFIKIIFFKLFYKKIRKIVSFSDISHAKVKKISFTRKNFYNLYVIPNVRVYSTTVHDTAYIYDNLLIKEPSYQYRYKKNSEIYNSVPEKNFCIKNGTPSFIKNIDGCLFSLLSGGASKNNYWHWMFDVLPKIGILEKAKLINDTDYFLVPSISKKFQLETLNLLNISMKKIINGEEFKHVECDKLIAADHPVVLKNKPSASMLNLPTWTIDWLKKKFLLNKNVNNAYKKIYIDRGSETPNNNRKIINEEIFKKYLINKGFKIINLSNYTFKEQIKIFQSSKIIIGLHGAGLTNIIFSSKKTKIIEIQTRESGNLYANLANKCKLNYKRIIEKNLSKNLSFQNFEIEVNLEKLKKFI